MANVDLHFPSTGYPVSDVSNIYFVQIINVCYIVSALVGLPRLFLSTDFIFEKKQNEFNTLPKHFSFSLH